MIDPNEAPEGFVAVEAPTHEWPCISCAFKVDDARCLDSACYKGSRKDRTNVIFVPRAKSNLAEHGDELQKAKDEAARWKAACLERDELIAKLKAQLTAALESIARMR